MGIMFYFKFMLIPRMDGGRKVSMDHVSEHPLFVLLDSFNRILIGCLRVCRSFGCHHS